jgi:hypothetical protein
MADTINYAAVGGAQQHTVTVRWAYLHDLLRPANAQHPAETLKTFYQLFTPYLNWASNAYNDPARPKEVVLPNSRKYKFYYNSYAELARVELPTGGAVEYDWGDRTGGLNNEHGPSWRRVVERRVYADGANVESRVVYQQPVVQTVSTPYGDERRTASAVDFYDGAGNKLYSEKHYYFGDSTESVYKAMGDPTRYAPWHEGKEYQTEVYDAAGNLLRTSTQEWAQRARELVVYVLVEPQRGALERPARRGDHDDARRDGAGVEADIRLRPVQ